MASDLIEQLFHAISIDDERGAVEALDLGASPLSKNEPENGRCTCKACVGRDCKQTALEFAVECNLYNAQPPGALRSLISTMLSRITQQQKNELLASAVRHDRTDAVRTLLEAGAVPPPPSRWLSLVQVARKNKSEQMKRLLQAAEIGATIETAMDDNESPVPVAPSAPSFTL